MTEIGRRLGMLFGSAAMLVTILVGLFSHGNIATVAIYGLAAGILFGAGGKLQAVLGFREDKPTTGVFQDEEGHSIEVPFFDDPWFWSTFAEYLNADLNPITGLPPCADSGHWDQSINLQSVNRGIICYMEAAYACFFYLPQNKPEMPLKPVTYIAAVDGTNRYVINILDYTPPQTVRIQVQN